jgi:hypothetical protein
MKGNSREMPARRWGRDEGMIAQPNGHRWILQVIQGLCLGAVIGMGAALSAILPAHAFPLSTNAQALSHEAGADALARPAAGPPCVEPCAETRYAERGYDPIAREIERLEPAPPPGSCEEEPHIERRRVVPDSSGLCGIRCWYWRLRHGYCGPGCEWYRYWANERTSPPGPRHPRYACRN